MELKRSLPLIAPAAPPAAWNGLRPAEPIADDGEVWTPQGAYAEAQAEVPLNVPATEWETPGRAELLAPAGGLDAGYAALHFGADSVYLGLKKFSARAEAENFTFEQVEELTAYAHGLTPRRRIFVTINTLIRQDELAELIDALAHLDEIGVDAVILQDLGVYHALRRWFPRLALHASTQLAVHNRAGVDTLRSLGFERVVLARELTFEEVNAITARAGIETEVFIHGALCYSYSGLCLFSAQTLGRSGNRGKCAYSCRDSFEVTGAPRTLRDGAPVRRDPRTGFPFSMKDLALPDHLPALRAAGVSCFKVEGRKKSPLYVATTTDYYRKLLDGVLTSEERPALEADLQTVFSRPWTRLFVHSHKDKEVADRDTVGHRGALIGTVEQGLSAGRPHARLRFRTQRPLERHDGLQVDLPIVGKPFGFPVDRMWVLDGKHKARESFTAPAGAVVEIALPPDYPELPRGAPVYCSSSQAVKNRYRYHRPKAGAHRIRKPLTIDAVLTPERLTLTARAADAEASLTLPGPFAPAQEPTRLQDAFHVAFSRLGDSRLILDTLTLTNDACCFVPVSLLNRARRELVRDLEARIDAKFRERIAAIRSDVLPSATPCATRTESFAWSLKIDRLSFVDAFTDEDWHGLDELIVDVTRDHPAILAQRLGELAACLGRERIRLALPALTRAWEEKNVRHKIATLRAAGWHKWEAANLSAWSYLGLDPAQRSTGNIDLATDWSVYVLNRMAAQQVLAMGATRFALSPEDGFVNARSLWQEFGPRAILIVYQDTPLFLAESCAYANLIGGCPGKANCTFEHMEMESSFGEKVTALDYHCRTIVLNQGPFCLAPHLNELAHAGLHSVRADFVYRAYEPAAVAARWRLLRAGKPIPTGHAANWQRGLQ
jgi:putative protease